MLFEVNILVISKLLVITDGCRFYNMKDTDNNHSRWQSFQFRFNSSAEIVCNQLNFNCKIFVFSRNFADFFSLCDNSANLNISQIFSPTIQIFFRLQIGDLISNMWPWLWPMTYDFWTISLFHTLLLDGFKAAPYKIVIFRLRVFSQTRYCWA